MRRLQSLDPKDLFTHVKFPKFGTTRWSETFPDPLNSPAHHARVLSITSPPLIDALAVDGTQRTFCSVSSLNIKIIHRHDPALSLTQLHGFSPTLKSLHLSFSFLATPEIIGLICSFPLLEDLTLLCPLVLGQGHEERISPPTSPRLSGSLKFHFGRRVRYITRQLLDLPNGLHFKKIAVQMTAAEDVGFTIDLVSGCSETLESLEITGRLAGMSPLVIIPIYDSPLHCRCRPGFT